MTKHKLTMFIYFYIYVSISFFFAPYLTDVKGFAPETVGYLTTIGLVLLIISFFTSGFLADKINSNKNIIVINLIISFFVIIGLIVANSHVLLGLFYILSWSNFIMITSQLDGLVIRDIDPAKYSTVRAFGSYGAAVSYFFNSYALNDLSLTTNLAINASLVVILVLLTATIKETNYEKNATLGEYKKEVSNALAIKPILYIMIITFLTYGTLSADDAYQVIYNTDIVGISATVMGIIGFISIVSEGSFMMIHKKLLNKFGLINTINIGVVTLLIIYITRFTMYTSPVIINIGSVLMGVFIGFYVPSAILIINRFIGEETKNIFLSLYQIMIRMGGVLIGLITTIFFDLTGSLQNIYFLHSTMIALSFIFIFKLKKEIENSDIK
ncbi:MFS transporter [Mollicutes bacterium LVI A0078]|nr:MFS transporter [Mollicutes bacterium LVI A0075]WOO91252.1 MFS transporter [Mollicutes bacterium LVI A0078]